MKKYMIFTVALVITTLIVLADDSKFTNALRNCSSYSESGNVNTEGMDVQSSKQIVGKQGDKCVYREKINFAGSNVTITCRFTQPQIKEITSVIDAYALVNQYSKNNIDTSKLSSVQDNPVVQVWNKYLQDSSVCTMEGLEKMKTNY